MLNKSNTKFKKIYLVGGGGHCVSCIDVIESTGRYEIAGIFDLPENKGKKILGYDILGGDSEIGSYVSPDVEFLITLGQIKSSELRKKIAQTLKKYNANIATVISNRAHVSKHAKIGIGTIVMHDALINANASVSENVIINTKALIEHDVVVGEFCHISTGAIVNGAVVIEADSFIGSQAVVKQGVRVIEKSIIQAGSFYRG